MAEIMPKALVEEAKRELLNKSPLRILARFAAAHEA